MDSEGLKYRRICRAVASTPWAITPERLADILSVLEFQAAGGKLTAAEIAAVIGPRGGIAEEHVSIASRGLGDSAPETSSIAVLEVRGIIAPRISAIDEISGPGGTSLERVAARFREAVEDPRVSGILFDIDSPGGSVDGVEELAAEIFDARGRKPIRAVANYLAASAAYHLASATDEISVSPSGSVGSIGVFAAHTDLSAKMEREGERVTLVSAGKFKVEGNPFEPLSDEALAEVQRRVDSAYTRFVENVARGRGVEVQDVINGFGQGRTVEAGEAVAEGMADRVETRDQAIARLSTDAAQGNARRAGRSAREFAFIGAAPRRSN